MDVEQIRIKALDVAIPNTFDNFVANQNENTLKCLQTLCEQSTQSGNVYLSGETGSGKSHLLQAICHCAEAQNKKAVYLPMHQVVQQGLEIVDGLENVDIVCVDDIDAIAGKREWEEMLFNLINSLRQKNACFIAAGLSSPKKTSYILPDLSSRLMWGGVYRLTILPDDAKAQAIKLRMRAKGDELSDEVVQWLLAHCSRDMHHLMQATNTLASESLHQSRRITIPLARTLLKFD